MALYGHKTIKIWSYGQKTIKIWSYGTCLPHFLKTSIFDDACLPRFLGILIF